MAGLATDKDGLRRRRQPAHAYHPARMVRSRRVGAFREHQRNLLVRDAQLGPEGVRP